MIDRVGPRGAQERAAPHTARSHVGGQRRHDLELAARRTLAQLRTRYRIHDCTIAAMSSASSPTASLIAATRPGMSGLASGFEIVTLRAALRRGRLNSIATWAIRIRLPARSASSRWMLMPTLALESRLMAPASP